MKNIKFIILVLLLSFLSCTRSYDEELLIAYGDSIGNLWTCNEDGSDEKIIRASGANHMISDITFSSDGEYLVYVDYNPSAVPPTWALVITDKNGNLVYESNSSTAAIARPRLNTDTSYIVVKGGGDIWPADTFLIDTISRDIELLSAFSSKFNHYSAISENSGFAIHVDAPSTIYKYNIQTDVIEQEWSTGSNPLMISASPDLKSVAFISNLDYDIKILNTVDGLVTVKSGLPGQPSYFSWSPDGSTIVFNFGLNQLGFLDVKSGIVLKYIVTGTTGSLTSVCYQFKPI